MIPPRMLLAVLALPALLAGCGHATYSRKASPPAELDWGFDGRLQAERGGQVVARAPTWTGLDQAVRCVPQSEEWAAQAGQNGRTGIGLKNVGWVTLVAAPTAGRTIMINGDDGWVSMAQAASVMLGGLVASVTMIGTGEYKRRTARTQAIDAVNFYNDNYWQEDACRQVWATDALAAHRAAMGTLTGDVRPVPATTLPPDLPEPVEGAR